MPRFSRLLALGGAALPLALALAVTGRPPVAMAMQADAEAGGDVFDTYCSDCHSVSAKGTNRKGPTLYGVMGRRAGIVPGFAYSAGMAKSGLTWNPQTLNNYLANPRGMFADGKMKKGLPKPEDRANVIAYLQRPD